VYVLQNGIYRFNKKWKKRGIGNLGNRQIEHLDTIEKDGNLYQVMKVLRVNRLRLQYFLIQLERLENSKQLRDW
jgi:hypothetical protein